MVPDKFNMVDMEGIDILFSYEDIIPGLYQKLVESITQCRYQCLYNWYFDGVLIPPTYVEMTVIDNKVWIGNGVSVDEEDTLEFLAPGLKSVTGEVAHITDALARKAEQIVCHINPVQDLHGYNHPWAGGSGKNIFDISKCTTSANSSIVIDGNEFILTCVNATWGSSTAQNGKINFIAGVSYVFSAYCTVLTRASNYQTPKLSVRNEINNMKATANLPSTDNTEQRISFVYTPTEDFTGYLSVVITGSTPGSASVKVRNPMIEIGSAVTDYEPYSNICPITGYTGLNVYRESSYDTEADPVIMDNWQDTLGTVYGGARNMAEGKLIVTDAEIASYDGEELPSTWISSMDVYAEGVTPTTGSQVVYKLAEPIIYDLTASQLPILLQGENYMWHDANGDISVAYWYNKF